MSDPNDERRICGFARASAERIRRLHALVDGLPMRARLCDGRLLVWIDASSAEPKGTEGSLNVHDSATPDGGYPFLQSHAFEFRAALMEFEFQARGRTAGDEIHVVIQDGDAFADRTIRIEG